MAANRFRGEVAVVCDGVTYTLRMDMGALAAFETDTGLNALDWAQSLEGGGNVKVSEMVAMMHAALARHHPDAAAHVASDILSDDPEILVRLMAAAAPDVGASEGNATGRAA